MDKRRNCSSGAISPEEQFLPSSTIVISYVKESKHISIWDIWLLDFFSSLEISYVEVRVSRCISESPLEFEITRADCI